MNKKNSFLSAFLTTSMMLGSSITTLMANETDNSSNEVIIEETAPVNDENNQNGENEQSNQPINYVNEENQNNNVEQKTIENVTGNCQQAISEVTFPKYESDGTKID